MKKTKSLKVLMAGAIIGCISLSAFSIPAMINNNNSSNADMFSISSTADLSITVYDKAGAVISEPIASDATVSIGSQTYALNGYNWEDVSYLSVKYNKKSTIPSNLEEYQYSFSVTYSQENSNGSSINLITDRASINNIFSATATSVEDIKTEIKFYIDDTNMTGQYSYSSAQIIGNDSIIGESYLKNGEWGLYQFSFSYNWGGDGTTTASTSSDIVEIKPTDIASISSPLQIETRIISSQFSIDNAYQFNVKLTNTDDDDSYRYNYVDRRKLVWSVTGTSHNGTKYCLLSSDIPENDNSTVAIFETYDNTGLSFKLDFDIGGTWTVTCEAVASNPEDSKVSEPVEVMNVNIIPQSIIIYIVIGVVALAVVALVVIIIVTKKKERVW